jgi:hypothetical protein
MDKKLKALLFVFFLLFTVFASTIVFNKSLVSFTRAKEDFLPSAKNSLLFAFPLLLKADGKTKCSISVFIRSDKGMPVKDQKVTISATVGQLETTEVTTDEKGKATVYLTSTTPGVSTVEAAISGITKLTQTLTITFE